MAEERPKRVVLGLKGQRGPVMDVPRAATHRHPLLPSRLPGTVPSGEREGQCYSASGRPSRPQPQFLVSSRAQSGTARPSGRTHGRRACGGYAQPPRHRDSHPEGHLLWRTGGGVLIDDDVCVPEVRQHRPPPAAAAGRGSLRHPPVEAPGRQSQCPGSGRRPMPKQCSGGAPSLNTALLRGDAVLWRRRSGTTRGNGTRTTPAICSRVHATRRFRDRPDCRRRGPDFWPECCR